MLSLVARSPAHACKSCPCFANCERICHYGMRCMVIISMTKKNLTQRHARCKHFDRVGGYDFFECLDDSLCNMVWSTVVGLMNQNDAVSAENEQLKNQLEQNDANKKDEEDEGQEQHAQNRGACSPKQREGHDACDDVGFYDICNWVCVIGRGQRKAYVMAKLGGIFLKANACDDVGCCDICCWWWMVEIFGRSMCIWQDTACRTLVVEIVIACCNVRASSMYLE